MKRIVICLALAWFAMGCGQNQTSLPANISGNYELALFPDLLFVTSTDKDELRALDLKASPRDFVRAPNPLEPLSIPVVSRPVGLTKDVHYESGSEVAGPWVYVHSDGNVAQPGVNTGISVVSTDRAVLAEVGRIQTSDVVTAMAAQGPATIGAFSTLYFATAGSGPNATPSLFSVQVPPPNGAQSLGTLSPTMMNVTFSPGDTVTALLVLPISPNLPGGGLVVAVRSTKVSDSRMFIVTVPPSPLVQYTTELKSSVLKLQTNAAAPGRPEGTLVYGALDPQSCAGIANCTGITAVDLLRKVGSDFQLATGPDGNPIPGIPSASGIPLSLDVVPGGQVAISNGVGTTPTAFDLLGLMSTSDGTIVFFDAKNLHVLDGNGSPPTVDTLTAIPPGGQARQAPPGTGPDLSSVRINGNPNTDEILTLTEEGIIPGFESQVVNSSNTDPNSLVVAAPAKPLNVVSGDIVYFTGCSVQAKVTGSSSTSITIDAMPTGCTPTVYSVRAPPHSYVVAGTVSGYLGQIASGEMKSFDLPLSYMTESFPSKAQLTFTLGAEDPQVALDFQYQMLFHSNYQELEFVLDTAVCSNCLLPTSVVQRVGLNETFVTYPASNTVIQFDPTVFTPNTPTQNIQFYH